MRRWCRFRLGRKCREGLLKNRYIARTFIMPRQSMRKKSVKLKLNPIRNEIEGKRIILVDDSIVRGTTSADLVKLVKDAGAKKVYFVSTCPPIVSPCVYGIDMSTRKELIAANLSVKEIREKIGADYLIYQSVEDLTDSVRSCNPKMEDFCKACMTGIYPTGDVTEEMLKAIDNERFNAKGGDM